VFGEGSGLRIHTRDFLYVGDVPAAALPNDACDFLLHSGMLPCFSWVGVALGFQGAEGGDDAGAGAAGSITASM